MCLLLERNATLVYSLNIDLYFGNKTHKHIELKKGDNIIIMYSSNGEKLIKTGIVKDIIPINIYNTDDYCSYGCSCCETCKSTAMIKIDASKNHQSDLIDILVGNILDIDFVKESELPYPTPPETDGEETV